MIREVVKGGEEIKRAEMQIYQRRDDEGLHEERRNKKTQEGKIRMK
jgi:hypothetical protein